METKNSKKNVKLTGMPTVLRYLYELTNENIPGIQARIKSEEAPDTLQSPQVEKKWRVKSMRLKENKHPVLINEFVDKITLSELLKKALVQGGIEGFYGTMVLFQYFWNERKLGKTLDYLDPQEVMNSILGEKSYKLNSKDRDRLCSIFRHLTGIEILEYNRKETERRIKSKDLKEGVKLYKRSTLFTYGQLVIENGKIIKLENEIRFMAGLFSENMTTEEYKKISRVFIPQESIMRISTNKRNKAKAVFLALICFDLSYIAQYKRDEKDYDLETCLKYGQWTESPEEKTKIWKRIIGILNDAKKNDLISYRLGYQEGKPKRYRYLKFIKVKREFSIDKKNLSLNMLPEKLELSIPQSKNCSTESSTFCAE